MKRRACLLGSATVLFVGLLWLTHSLLHHPSWLATSAASSYVFKGPLAGDQVVVLAKVATENVDWVAEELPDWQHAIYHMDDPTWVLHPPANRGREAMAYLTYLVDHFDTLPEIMVFVHAHRAGWPQAWHTDAPDYDNARSIRDLRLDYVRHHGYANLRCLPIPGCPDEVQPFRNDTARSHERAFAAAYASMFSGDAAAVPPTVGAACCSQFAVSRAQVRARPRSDYVRYRRWLLDTDLDSEVSGRVMEYMWHMIFGKGPVWCPELAQCWCEQFGRCGGVMRPS